MNYMNCTGTEHPMEKVPTVANTDRNLTGYVMKIADMSKEIEQIANRIDQFMFNVTSSEPVDKAAPDCMMDELEIALMRLTGSREKFLGIIARIGMD